MEIKMNFKTGIFATIFSVFLGALILGGCNSIKDGNTVEIISLKPNVCPIPTGLQNYEKTSAKELSTEIGGIVKYIGSVDFETKINETLKKKYNQDTQVQMIYALTYSACVSCRVSSASPTECMNAFRPIIDKYTKFLPESTSFSNYEKYYKEVLW
jgi:hypothetical protein